MDKVCDLCGDTGFAETIFTCCMCKKASEHIYCMRPQLEPVEGLWRCEECLASLHSDAMIKARFTNQKITQNGCSDAVKAYTQRGKELSLVESRNSKINYDKHRLSGKEKQFCHGTSKTAETAKVKFISEREAALLGTVSKSRACNTKECFHASLISNTKPKVYDTKRNWPAAMKSGTKTMAYDKWQNWHTSSHQSAEGNITPPSAAKCTTLNISRVIGSNTPKTVTQASKGTVDTRVNLSSSNSVMTRKHVMDGKKGDEASQEFCIKDTTEGPAEVTNSKSVAVPLFANDEQVTDSSLDKGVTAAAPVERPVEVCANAGVSESSSKHIRLMQLDHDIDGQFCASNVEPVETSVPDTVIGGSHNEIAKNLIPGGGSGMVVCSDPHVNRHCYKDMDQSLILLITPDMKFADQHVPDICWKGTFDVFYEDFNVCCGIEAHFSCQVSYKAYEISKRIPKLMKFNVIPRACVWPRIFQLDPPTYEDVGLYFLPSEIPGSKENYVRLLERMNSHDFALQSQIGDVKLQIYISTHLPLDSKRPVTQMYLWGIFCHVRRKKLSCDLKKQPSSETPCTSVIYNQSNNHQKGNSTEIHGTGKNKLSPVAVFDPPEFWKPRSEVDGKSPLVMSASKNVTRPISPEFPPGFPWHSTQQNESSSYRVTNSRPCKETIVTRGHCQDLRHEHRSRGSNIADSNLTHRHRQYTMKAGSREGTRIQQGAQRAAGSNINFPYDRVIDKKWKYKKKGL